MENGEREEGYRSCRSSANTFVLTQNQKLSSCRSIEKKREILSRIFDMTTSNLIEAVWILTRINVEIQKEYFTCEIIFIAEKLRKFASPEFRWLDWSKLGLKAAFVISFLSVFLN